MDPNALRLPKAADAVLVAGLLAAGPEALELATSLLTERYGAVMLAGEPVAFAWTRYYEREMGPGLTRQFLAFERPFYPGLLGRTKRETCRLEQEHARDGRRIFNLDPGYLTLSALVVASTKEASYRVYLGDGTYAQPMLVYRDRHFHPYEWTYADYADGAHLRFFEEVRALSRQRGLLA
jgi:hypothetical protein